MATAGASCCVVGSHLLFISMTILTFFGDYYYLYYPLGPGGGHVPVSIQDVKSVR